MSTSVQPVAPRAVQGRVHEARVPSALRCFALLGGIKVSLVTLGFGRTRGVLARLTRSRESAIDGRTDVVNATAKRVVMAAAFFPGRALCLEQSLTLWYLLRRSRIQATFRLGVQAYPFVAHAWVEHAGQPVNESPETLKPLVPLPNPPETWR